MGNPKFANVKRGDRVKILSGSGPVGRIVELRGPLGPNGMQIYRIRLRRKPKPTYVEVREDQLELLDPPQTSPTLAPGETNPPEKATTSP